APPPATLPIAVLATVDDPGPWAGPEEIDEATAARDQLVTLAEATNATLTVAVPPSVARRTATTVDDTDPSASVPAGSASAPATEVAPTASSVASDGTAAGPGETATPAAPRLADRLIGDELLARPMIPLDPSALAGIHRSTLFSSQLRAGEEALAVAS